MPELGEEARAEDIGRNGGGRKFSWVVCPRCNEERWVHKKTGISGGNANKSRLCKECAIFAAKHGFHVWSNSTFRKDSE